MSIREETSTIQKKLPGFKICLLGDKTVGKSSLRKIFVGEGVPEYYENASGSHFTNKNVVLSSNREVLLQIWDFAGQQHINSIRSLYFKGSMGALAVYDITRPDTYFNLKDWCLEFWAKNDYPDIGAGPRPIVVLGNKSDLAQERNIESVVLPVKGQKLADRLVTQSSEFNAKTAFFETSIKTGMNVERAFICLGNFIENFLRANPQHGPLTGL